MIALTVSLVGVTAHLSWTDGAPAPGKPYTVNRSTNGGSPTTIAITSSSAYVDGGLSPGQTYGYQVTCVEQSNAESVTPPTPIPPSPDDVIIATNCANVNSTNGQIVAVRGAWYVHTAVILGSPAFVFREPKSNLTATFPVNVDPNTPLCWTSADTLFAWSLMSWQQWLVIGGLPPRSVSMVGSVHFGDAGSRGGPAVLLLNGALVGMWTQGLPYQGTNDLEMGFSYRAPSGLWSSIRVVMPADGGGNITGCRLALCQHPVDGAVWAFIKRDAYNSIHAVRLQATPSGLVVSAILPRFITQAVHGDNGPEGELPDMQAVPDPKSGTIVLTYQARPYKIFSTDPFIKGAKVAFASIAASGALSFAPQYPEWVDRVGGLSLSLVGGDDLWLAYRQVDPPSSAYNVLTAQRRHGVWQPPRVLGTTPRSQVGKPDQPLYLVAENGNLHEITER